MSSTREVAEQIVAELHWINLSSLAPKQLAERIDTALRQREEEVRAEERERCAKIVSDAGEKWGEKARARRSKTYAAYVIAALDLEGQIRRDHATQEGEGS